MTDGTDMTYQRQTGPPSRFFPVGEKRGIIGGVIVVFMGSDDVSCAFLRALITAPEHTVAAVVTQPDRRSGRDRRLLTPTPLRAWMLKHGWKGTVFAPDDINTPETHALLHGCRPDIIVVVAYGQFLGQPILDMPRHGCLNIHLSLLPLLRGAAPIHRAIMQGHDETGVTAMRMDIGMDSGDIYGTLETPILPTDTHASLAARLIDMGCSLMVKTLADLHAGTATRTAQDHSKKTVARKILRDDRMLNWAHTADALERAVRTFYPKPGAIATLPGGALVKVLRAEVIPRDHAHAAHPPGTLLAMAPPGPVIACGHHTALRLLELHPEGKPRPQSGTQFVHGHKVTLPVGAILPPPT